jgi:hypothetical protein
MMEFRAVLPFGPNGWFTALDLFTIILILIVVILVAGLFLATRNRW